jgi:glyoxylase-like metal-dependent hydrolase (beta-lactamase superfamily II)
LRALGVEPEAVTHVFLSHHHPDHTMNIALFPNAEVVDFWARYIDDQWLDMPGDGYHLSPNAELWLTPGHTGEDASLIVRADDGVYAMTHLWWHADRGPEIDPFADDQDAINAGRRTRPGRGRRGDPGSRRPVPRRALAASVRPRRPAAR